MLLHNLNIGIIDVYVTAKWFTNFIAVVLPVFSFCVLVHLIRLGIKHAKGEASVSAKDIVLTVLMFISIVATVALVANYDTISQGFGDILNHFVGGTFKDNVDQFTNNGPK